MIHQSDIIGIVACGGNSTRMGTDKGLLPYFGIPQRYYLYQLFAPFCQKTYISCRMEQAQSIEKSSAYIKDEEQFAGHGPVSGLLSCFTAHPGTAILFSGCDYPYINRKEIERLLSYRNKEFLATAFCNKLTGKPEPLFTIYEYASFEIILKRFKENKFSLREFLESSTVHLIHSPENNLLKSIDTPEEYEKVMMNQC